MTDTSRVRLGVVREATIGTTPGSPRLRAANVSSINLDRSPVYETPEQLRADRMQADAELAGENNGGTVGMDLTFPRDLWPTSEWLRSLFNSPWTLTPQHDNDGTAASAITSVAISGVYNVANQGGSGGFAGTAYVVRHLVRATDFGVAANSGIGRVTASTATSVTTTIATAAEASPAAAARLKVVGFEGAAGDITANANGLGSTALNFTTLGLLVGQWVNVGGASAPFRFAITPANNGWARITRITANQLDLDNRPAGWGVDAGTGITLRVFIGDVLRNGVTELTTSIEQGYMGQAAPTYILQAGMHVATGEINMVSKRKVTATFGFLGMSGSQGTTSADAALDPELDPAAYPVFTCSTNVGRVAEAGAPLAAPNFCRSMRWRWDNNSRPQDAINVPGAVGIGHGVAGLGIDLETYFGDNSLLTKAMAGTATSLNVRLEKSPQVAAGAWRHAIVLTAPRGKLSGFPTAPAPNQDSMLNLSFLPSFDAATNCHYQMDRVEYFEA